jgi:homoserine dehydrogenase
VTQQDKTSAAPTPVGIALLGAGVVGRGVLDVLRQQATLLTARTGLTPVVRHVVARSAKPELKDYRVGTDVDAAIRDPAVSIVVEVMGGIDGPARHVAAALRAGKHVVTANKAMLAERGPELFALAKANGVSIGFEASCGGGIPIIDALTRGLIGNRIDALFGIINGTCNYILTQMSQRGQPYADALADAQKIGFAEADPTLDVSGRDAAQKLAILATLAFNAQVREGDLGVSGIDTLETDDIQFAKELGYAIKLLAIAERTSGGLDLRVHPTLVHKGDLLADVNGGFNAISVYGSAIGHQLFYGRGAGSLPTASAVVADLFGVAMGTIPHAFERLNVFPGQVPDATVLPKERSRSRFYLRMMTRDEPGVLAQVTQALSRRGISVSGVFQREVQEGTKLVPIIVTTHTAGWGDVQAALAEIDALPTVDRPTVCWRILERPAEFAEPS